MQEINIHDAKTHFSRLVERVGGGESVIIAKAGRPVAKLVPLDAVSGAEQVRTGFLRGRVRVPDDFDVMGGEEIAAEFSGRP